MVRTQQAWPGVLSHKAIAVLELGRVSRRWHRIPIETVHGTGLTFSRNGSGCEDDRDLRDLAAAVLEETSLRVVEAESGEEALDYLRLHADEVAFVFTDVRLPGS